MTQQAALNLEREHVEIEIGKMPYEVVKLDGTERLMGLFAYEVGCATRDTTEPINVMLGKAAKITLTSHGHVRRVYGIVTEASRAVSDDGSGLVIVVVRPEAYLLTLGRDNRVFQDQTVIDIVKAVLASNGQSTRWDITESYEQHIYCAQYRESDWNFISRLLEEEGIYCWFDHEGEKSTLVFSDRSSIAPELPGGALLAFAPESGQHADREVVFELGEFVAAHTTKFAAGSFDPARPRLRIEAVAGEGPFEAYDAPGGGPESPQTIERQVRQRLQAAIAASRGVTGKSTGIRLVPGMVMAIDGCTAARLDGRYVLTNVTTTIVQRRRGPAGGNDQDKQLVTAFSAIREATCYRPLEITRPSKQAGLQTGQVVGAKGAEVHPDPRGRVRVKMRWDRNAEVDDRAGKWMRVAQRGTAESMLLPRMGWNVLTMNDEGTTDAPWVLSRIHDAEHPPAYSLPRHKTRVVWKTATTPGGGSFHEIYFEDQRGREEMFLNASKDMTILTQNVKNSEVVRDQVRSIGRDHTMSVGASHHETIGKNQNVAIGNHEKIVVAKGSAKKVTGNESITIGGSRNITTGDVHTTSVKGNRQLGVATTLIDVAIGSISSASQWSTVVVGGARVRMSEGTISEETSQVKTETIGGSKMELSGTNYLVDVRKSHSENVGGSMVLHAGGNYADTADCKAFWKVGTVLSAKAPQVCLEAKERIEIRCGGSSIVLTTDTVEIVSPSYDMSGAVLDVDTVLITHN